MNAPRPATGPAKIVIVDDHAIVRDGLEQLLSGAKDLQVVAKAGNADEALEAVKNHRPQLAIVDLSLGGKSGLELIKDLKIRYPETAVLVVSMYDESLYAERVVRAGARGYVMKQEASDRILAAVRRVLGGGFYLSDQVAATVFQHMSAGRGPGKTGLESLSDRELEVFNMIGQGKTTREIAETLFLSVKTVESHREHIKEKLNLSSANELLRYAAQRAMEGS
jgi:DNA-binding NarL/FixJ family response regulator